MPTMQAGESDTVLYFEDSGVPPDSPLLYTTLVLIHGLIFHGGTSCSPAPLLLDELEYHAGTFRRMIPYAKQSKLRLVLLNMRDYPGSSPYTQVELEALQSPDTQVQASALKQHGVELAAFLVGYIRDNNIPAPQKSADGNIVGGLAVVSWSLANIVTYSFLSRANDLSINYKDVLGRYLRTVVLYGGGFSVFSTIFLLTSWISGVFTSAIGEPAQIDSSLDYQSLTAAQKAQFSMTLVSSYYPPIDNLAEATPVRFGPRGALHLSDPLQHDLLVEKRPTVELMSPEELNSVTDSGALERSSGFFLRLNPAILKKNFERAHWLDSAMPLDEHEWPDLKLLVVWCDMDMNDCILAAARISQKLDSRLDRSESSREGEKPNGRKTQFAKFEAGNHFVSFEFEVVTFRA